VVVKNRRRAVGHGKRGGLRRVDRQVDSVFVQRRDLIGRDEAAVLAVAATTWSTVPSISPPDA
jgi:hypothetical protein